ncbi:plasmid mobilization relaxosome protein MobC, partial [Catenibacterium mitsuokai]|uniref:plasmid mobilization relaxosome protein MobC n=1 Tax=Catenibacterium mitsuokai TaxID=100886 RepID=UPI0022E5799B
FSNILMLSFTYIFILSLAIDGYIIQLDYTAIKEQTAEIQKVGVNVNQIARRVNSAGNAYKEDLEEIKGALEKIWQLQRYTLSKLR